MLADARCDQLVYVDESGCREKMLRRTKGWSKRARAEVERSAKLDGGAGFNVIAALCIDGFCATTLTDFNTTGDVFEEEFVRHRLVPILGSYLDDEPKSIVVMDNASVHRVTYVRQLVESVGAILILLPQYSPDLNPIEEAFSKMKHMIRRNLRGQPKLTPLIVCEAMATVTPRDCAGYFRHAGVGLPQP